VRVRVCVRACRPPWPTAHAFTRRTHCTRPAPRAAPPIRLCVPGCTPRRPWGGPWCQGHGRCCTPATTTCPRLAASPSQSSGDFKLRTRTCSLMGMPVAWGPAWALVREWHCQPERGHSESATGTAVTQPPVPVPVVVPVVVPLRQALQSPQCSGPQQPETATGPVLAVQPGSLPVAATTVTVVCRWHRRRRTASDWPGGAPGHCWQSLRLGQSLSWKILCICDFMGAGEHWQQQCSLNTHCKYSYVVHTYQWHSNTEPRAGGPA